MLHSLANAPITDPPNLPADQAVRTEYPPASGIINQQGTLEASISPVIVK